MYMNWSDAAFARVIREPSFELRTELIKELFRQFEKGELVYQDKQKAMQVFLIIVRDPDIHIRDFFAKLVKDCRAIAHEVIWQIALDDAEVANIVITNSPILTDSDLINIINWSDNSKQIAVSKRKMLSSIIISELIDKAGDNACVALITNKNVSLPSRGITAIMEKFGGKSDVRKALLCRESLPASVVEELISELSSLMRQWLIKKDGYDVKEVNDTIIRVNEIIITDLANISNRDEMVDLVEYLYRKKRITSTLILRALSYGEMRFVEYLISGISGLPILRVASLIKDYDSFAIKVVFRNAELPIDIFPAFRLCVKTYFNLIEDSIDVYSSDFKRKMMDRILSNDKQLKGANYEYLTALLFSFFEDLENAEKISNSDIKSFSINYNDESVLWSYRNYSGKLMRKYIDFINGFVNSKELEKLKDSKSTANNNSQIADEGNNSEEINEENLGDIGEIKQKSSIDEISRNIKEELEKEQVTIEDDGIYIRRNLGKLLKNNEAKKQSPEDGEVGGGDVISKIKVG